MDENAGRITRLLEEHGALMAMVHSNAAVTQALQTVGKAASVSSIAAGASHHLSRAQIGCAYYSSSSKGVDA